MDETQATMLHTLSMSSITSLRFTASSPHIPDVTVLHASR